MHEEFINAMHASGLVCKEAVIADGEVHRFASGGRGNKNGWYVLFEHGGAFGDWKLGISEKWTVNNQHMTPEGSQLLQAKIAAAKEVRNREIATRQEKVAEKVSRWWQKLPETGNSAYLERKQVEAYGLRFGKEALAVPMRDVEGKLWNLQTIYPDGSKRFLKGGRKKACFHIIGTLEEGAAIYVCEGYATAASVHMATGQPVVVAFDAGNVEPVIAAIRARYLNISLTIASDNDQWKQVNTGKEKAEEAARKHGCKVILPEFFDTIKKEKPTDFNDLHVLAGLEEVKRQFLGAPSVLKAITLHDFLAMDIKPQEMLLSPIIPKQGVCMVYAYRGIGKTQVALGIAYAVATGSQFLKWKALRPCRVLYIDGEMPAVTMQERLAREVALSDATPPAPDYLRIITPDLQEKGIPSLTHPDGQEEVNKLLNGVELVIIDNISTLCRGGRENESESWAPVQEWALYLRKKGISVLFIHHAGKNNQQRGASKREDIMDTVISLKRPEDYESSQGARFEVHYEKARGFTGEEATPFEAWLKTGMGRTMWEVSEMEDRELATVLLLKEQGLTQRDIAKEAGFSPAKVNRLLKKAKEETAHANHY